MRRLNRGLPSRDLLVAWYFVPAEHQAASRSTTGETVRDPAIFATTQWSVVLEAQGESATAYEALEKLCRTYWRPIYSFVRRQGAGAEDAEDLTQGFFALVLERKDLSTVRKEKGRLRSYLLASVKNFLTDEARHAMATKRGKGQDVIPLDEIRECERTDMAKGRFGEWANGRHRRFADSPSQVLAFSVG